MWDPTRDRPAPRFVEPEPIPTPKACPYCRSSELTTASKAPDASAYWRCKTCGQMWNVARHRTSQPYGYPGR